MEIVRLRQELLNDENNKTSKDDFFKKISLFFNILIWNQTSDNNQQVFQGFCDYPDPGCKCDGTNECKYTQLAFWVDSEGRLNYHKRSEAFCNNVNILAVAFWTLVSTLMLGVLVIIAMKVIVVYLDNKEQKQFRADTQKTLSGKDGVRRQTSFRSSMPSTPLMQDVGGFTLKK